MAEIAEQGDKGTAPYPYKDLRLAKPWCEELKDAQKPFEKWQEKCDNIDSLYADLEKLSATNKDREMQMFWANLEVLKPSIYARPPVPVVGSRFKDRRPLTRHASEIVERSLITSFERQDIDSCLIHVRDDLALHSRGVVWPRFTEDGTGEVVEYDHLDRKDFVHGRARKWKEVPWVAKCIYLTMEEMRDRFEEASGNAYLKCNYTCGKDDENTKSYDKKCKVWELWHKDKNLVVWFAEGPDEVLDIQEPFLTLDGFFPCPKPAYGTLKPGTLIPVPDFLYYKDQIEEINELTARISALSEALRLKGFYSAGNEDISTAVEAALKNQDNNAIMIPVPNVAVMGGQGMDKAIMWLPVREVAEVITSLVALRKQLIDDVYQITGLSDIMRGSSNPNETLGAQQLKSQYGSVRIKDRQEAMVKVALHVTRIAGEIMAENFSPQTLLDMSQYEEVPSQAEIMQQVAQVQDQIRQAASNPEIVQRARQNPQAAQQILQQAQQQIQELQSQITIEQVMQFLRDQRMRPFTLEIETDSTIQPDENMAKQRASEFLTALGSAIGQLSPMVTAQPQSAPFAGEVLKFAVAPFRAGRELEAAIDEFVDSMKQVASQPKPDPEAEKAKVDAQLKVKEAEREDQVAKVEAQHTMAETQKTQAETAQIAQEMAMPQIVRPYQ
jgi:hypothetical protein